MSGLKLAGLAAALALVIVSAAAAAAGPGTRASVLRTQAATLGARAHQATLDLYALDSQLGAARTRLGSLQAQATRLRSQQLVLAQQIAATQRTLVVSRQQLGANLRLLYEQGDTDPIAVMLGAQSIEDAMSRLDYLQRTADQSRRFVAASTYAQIRLVRLRTTLAAHRARIAAAVVSARRTAEELVATRAARAAFVDRLRSEQRLKTAQIRALEAIVHRAEVKSQALSAAAAAAAPVAAVAGDPPPAPAPAASPAPVQTGAASTGRTLTVVATGYSLPGHTATGLPVAWGVVAVDPTVIPLGTRMTVPGYGDAVAADVGSGVRGAMIDLWFPSLAQAFAWGRRTVTITLH